MNKILRNIHWLFWGCIPVLLLYGYFSRVNYIDINIKDWMFVISSLHVVVFFSLLFFVTGLCYYFSYKSDKYKAVDTLTIIHVALTFVGLGLIFFVPEYTYELPAESVIDMNENLRKSKLYDTIKIYSSMSVFIAQPTLLLNLIISIFRK